MSWLRFTGILFIACVTSACVDTNYTVPLNQKKAVFSYLNDSLRVCYSSSSDSVLHCARTRINRAIQGVNASALTKKIWLSFGEAHALSESDLGYEAIAIINAILPETEDFDFLYERAELLTLRSFINTNHFNLQLAAYDAYLAADIFDELGLYNEDASKRLSVANLQYNTANFELAIENAQRAIALFEKATNLRHEDTVNFINAYNTLGMSYINMNKVDSAAISYNKALPMTRSIHSKIWEGLIQGNIARIDYIRGNLDDAEAKYNQELAACLEYGERAAAGKSLTGLAEVYIKKKEFTKAKVYYDSAWKLMQQERRPSIWLDYYKSLHNWFEITKQYDSAHLTFEKYVLLRDSIQSPQRMQLIRLQRQMQFEKQLSLLRAENDLKKSELTTSRILITSFIIVLVLLCVLLYIIRKNYKKISTLNSELENKVKVRTAELLRLNSELDTYLYRASHDVRRPILSIIGLGQLAGLTHDENERKAIQQKIDNTARDMDKMLSKIHMAYELDKLDGIQSVNIHEYIEGLVDQFKGLYPAINFNTEIEHNVIVSANPKLLDIIFINILENACIFNNRMNPEISIRTYRTQDYVEIYFRDNGIGIDRKYLDSIFNPYTRYSDRSVGSGLGLHLVQKALQKLNGIVAVESTLYIGTEFKIILPAYKNNLSHVEAEWNEKKSFS
ncbi:MAG TPA: ATP-binding protein [Ohtaekwangia sp.]|uniref:ATP-binding protein n=1 Tax=Ohtaekwangia sp. TaxID=2066019 RepID=UPI002F94879F